MELKHDYMGPDHLLLGLLRDPEERVAELLDRLGTDPRSLEEALLASLRPGHGPPRPGELPYTSWAKKTLERAMADARDQGAPTIEAEHLFLALSSLSWRGAAAEVLEDAGVTPERLRRIRKGQAVPLPPERARGTRVASQVPPPEPDSGGVETLVGLMRPVAVAAFHLGATRRDLEVALGRAMEGISEDPGAEGPRRRGRR